MPLQGSPAGLRNPPSSKPLAFRTPKKTTRERSAGGQDKLPGVFGFQPGKEFSEEKVRRPERRRIQQRRKTFDLLTPAGIPG